VRIAFVRLPLNVQPCALGDRARRIGFKVLAKMFRRNVRQRAKLHLETRYSPRALLAGNRVFAALLFIGQTRRQGICAKPFRRNTIAPSRTRGPTSR
jgi:hypothetical protein